MRSSFPIWHKLMSDKKHSMGVSPNVFFIDPHYVDSIAGTYSAVFGNADGIVSNEIVLELPFKYCYFELTGDTCFRAYHGIVEADKEFVFDCVAIKEVYPGSYQITVLENFKGLRYFKSSEADGQLLVKYLDRILKKIREKDSRLGVSFNNKVRTIDKKMKSKINKIIYIVPKEKTKTTKGPNHQQIDWSHCWEVRGHWRKCSSIGKDREGNYLIKGFTWVKDHVKGPEDKDLVIKTRVFKSENSKTEGIQNAQTN